MKVITRFAASLLVLSMAHSSYAQTQVQPTVTAPVAAASGNEYGSGLKISFNPESPKYLRFMFWNQVWARSIDNNPGSSVAGESSSSSTDLALRRVRMLAYAQLSSRYLILLHIGINNVTFNTGGGSGTTGTGAYGLGKKPQLFVHEAYNEYAVIPAVDAITKKVHKYNLYIGGGLHYWNGISRMSSASTLNFLTIDAPIFNWPLIENSDQFGMQMGVYAKGRLGKIGYTLNVNKPYATNLTPTPGGAAVDNNGNSKAGFSGYFDYQFFDQEANTLAYRVGSYLGTKKVFNIGAGFYSNKDGVKVESKDSITSKQNIGILSADVFADLPVGSKKHNMAVTVYSVFYKNDFGKNYIRYSGTMNNGAKDDLFKGTTALEGYGNSRVLTGTGSIWYTQAGFLLPRGISKKFRLQPFAAYTYKNLDALNAPGSYWDAGANLLLDGHNAKITLQYSNRDLYSSITKQVMTSKGEILAQLQIFL